jgi:CHAT domain-containing protein
MEAKSKPVGLNPEEQSSHEAYEKIAGQITALGVEFSDLRAKRSRTAEEEARLNELKDKLVVANQEMARFFKTLYVEFGKNAQANQSAEAVREETSGMQGLVRELGPGTVALYTLVGETRYRVIVITGSTMQAREYPIAAADLRKKVAAFLEKLKNPVSDPLPAAQELYKILVAPMAEDLKGAKAQTLMWSLNDVLRYVPMAALHDGKRYLVENYRNVVITPASIARLKDKVAVSDSSIAGMGVSKDYDGLGPLPAVPGELKHIIRDAEIPGAEGALPGTVMLDDDFTETRMARALDKHYPVVHIASHFVLQAGNETNSYLLLGGKDVGGKGYHLTLAELRDDPALTFDGTELLTLSACQTGASGTALNGREVDGLGITAQQKGAKAVLASLWSVADQSTALLMADFYKQWLASPGTTKAAALRQAQLDMLRGTAGSASASRPKETKEATEKKTVPPFSHPFYWAPFILIGNWK